MLFLILLLLFVSVLIAACSGILVQWLIYIMAGATKGTTKATILDMLEDRIGDNERRTIAAGAKKGALSGLLSSMYLGEITTFTGRGMEFQAVAAVVIGRHVNRHWHDNDRRLRAIEPSFDWSRCAVCEGAADVAAHAADSRTAPS